MDILFYSVQEQSRSDTEKLIADMTSLVSDHIRRQMDLVSFGCSFHSSIFLVGPNGGLAGISVFFLSI